MNAACEMKPLRGSLTYGEPLARHTSWRVGGPAERFYVPADLNDLAQFLQQFPADEPLFWLGLGSNLLVRDGGIRGTVIATAGALAGLAVVDATMVRAEAGVASAKVARFAAERNLAGAEFLAGIPGSIGGALAMNAGAFGGETWGIVAAVETIDRHGVLRRRPPADYDIAYRHVHGPANEWFVAAHFSLAAGESIAARQRIRELLARRGATQPMQSANAGSVFKNPEGDYAARLIEACGLKGTCEGKACVSEMHANFIVNTGSATAAEIETLIARVRDTVLRVHGVQLEHEVRIIGEAK